MNKKLNKTYSSKSLNYYFKLIVSLGIREPLPPKANRQSLMDCTKETRDKYLYYANELEKRYVERRKTGEKITQGKIIEEMAEEYNLSLTGLNTIITKGKRLKRNMKSNNE